MNRIDKNNYYIDIAETVLERNICIRRTFGAAIVKKHVSLEGKFGY